MATVASHIFLSPLFLSLQISLLPFVFSSFTSHPFLCTIAEKNKIFTLLMMTVQFSSVFKILICVVLIFQLFFRSFKLIFFVLLITHLFSSTRVKSRIVTTRIYGTTGTAGTFPYCFYFLKHDTKGTCWFVTNCFEISKAYTVEYWALKPSKKHSFLMSALASMTYRFFFSCYPVHYACISIQLVRHGMALTKADTEMASQGPMPCFLLLFPKLGNNENLGLAFFLSSGTNKALWGFCLWSVKKGTRN